MKGKTAILTALLCIVALCLGLMLYQILTKHQKNQLTKTSKQTLPNFTFYNLDSLPVSKEIVGNNQAVCLFYFNADCEHCQYEAKEIHENLESFKTASILMVSFNTIKEIKAFANKYQLNQPNIHFLQDPKYQFSEWFGKASVPAVYIYNSKQQLVKEYQGETKIEAIVKYLE